MLVLDLMVYSNLVTEVGDLFNKILLHFKIVFSCFNFYDLVLDYKKVSHMFVNK